MQHHSYKELIDLNNRSAHAMSFLVAGAIALIGFGFLQHSLPAFLLSIVFLLNLAAEFRAYKESIRNEVKAAKLHELMQQLTTDSQEKQNNRVS
ncbi:hypothetical protein [Planococcus sp. YIM B11945]|uniref:hypothetical protein n=1 Tax=Planococcus sp. YIM B11945 TaxID=3435410 RepID=UPI003D7C9344